MMQDAHAEDEIHGFVRKRDGVRRTRHEQHRTSDLVHSESFVREVERGLRVIDTNHTFAMNHRQQTVPALTTAEIQHELAGDIPDEMVDVFEWERRVGWGVEVTASLALSDVQGVNGSVRSLCLASRNLGLFPMA